MDHPTKLVARSGALQPTVLPQTAYGPFRTLPINGLEKLGGKFNHGYLPGSKKWAILYQGAKKTLNDRRLTAALLMTYFQVERLNGLVCVIIYKLKTSNAHDGKTKTQVLRE